MDEKEPRFQYDIQKRARAGTSGTLRAAVALYILYIGYTLLRDTMAGVSSLPAWLGWLAGLVFMGAAVAFGVYTYRRYRAELAAAKLPPETDAEEETHGPEDAS